MLTPLSRYQQVGNDIRQSLNAMQMWRAKSSTVSYSDMKQGTYPACLRVLAYLVRLIAVALLILHIS
jgi:hypothetical protein